MREYKNGDAFKIVVSPWTDVKVGDSYYVEQVLPSGVNATVGGVSRFFYYGEIEPHRERDASAIVCLVEDGQPKPSVTPHVHGSESDAFEEAKRLSRTHRGEEFGVYVHAGSRSQPRPRVDYEWQRLALSGSKIASIKELRELCGIGLKPAKDAVEEWARLNTSSA